MLSRWSCQQVTSCAAKVPYRPTQRPRTQPHLRLLPRQQARDRAGLPQPGCGRGASRAGGPSRCRAADPASDGLRRRLRRLSWAAGNAIVCSITPFGITGPYRTWRATHLTSCALGGAMSQYGPPKDHPGHARAPALCPRRHARRDRRTCGASREVSRGRAIHRHLGA